MRRTLFIVMVFLVAVNPAFAGAGKKLTNKELKQLFSKMFFAAGYSTRFRNSFHQTWFPNGTRNIYWTGGVTGHMVKSKWWLNGDNVCVKNADWVSEKCDEWRRSGDRIETWSHGGKNGYMYILRQR